MAKYVYIIYYCGWDWWDFIGIASTEENANKLAEQAIKKKRCAKPIIEKIELNTYIED